MLPLRYLLLAGLPLLARAQAPAGRHATVLDLTGGVGPTLNYASVAGWRLWGLDAGGRFQAGLGVRTSYFFARQADFDGQTSETPGYALRVEDPRLVALNVALHLRARVARPLHLGFNLDLAGVSLGATRPAQFVADNGLSLGSRTAEPVRGNVLLGGLPDRGSLNSELYAGVALPAGFSLRVGYSHLVTAYESAGYSAGNLTDTGRYRRFRNLASLGVSYQLRTPGGF